MNAISSTPTLSAVSVTSAYTNLVTEAQLPLNTVSYNQAGVGANGSCSLLLRLASAVNATVDLKLSVVKDGVTYVYNEIASVTLGGLSADVVIPVQLPLGEKLTIAIKASSSFTVTSGLILFQ